jgi:hypothetical protein
MKMELLIKSENGVSKKRIECRVWSMYIYHITSRKRSPKNLKTQLGIAFQFSAYQYMNLPSST